MIGACGACARTLAISEATGATHQRSNSAGGRTPAHEFEDLHGFRPGGQLAQKIFGRGVDETIDQGGEKLRLPIGEEPRRRLIGRAAPGDHVARDRPRRAAEADQRDVARQEGLQAVDRLEHRREFRPIGRVAKFFQVPRVLDRREARAFAALERNNLPERVRHHEDIGEKDRRIEAEATDRLQGRFHRQGRRIAEVEEGRARGRGSRGIREDSAPPDA